MGSRLIDELMEEHRLIEELLGSLLRVASAAAPGRDETRSALGEHVELLRQFADAWHHAREEEILFVAMVRAGFPREAGPIAVMLHEHELGRGSIRALSDLAGRSGPLTTDEVAALETHARAFTSLLSAHITKEDRVLYPMALERLGAALVELDARGEARSQEEPGRRDALMQRARDLSQRTKGAR